MIQVGDTIISKANKQYVIEKQISQGGFGKVFLGKDENGNKVVIKVAHSVNNNQNELQYAQEKLKIEGDVLRFITNQTNIPGIVKAVDEYEDPSTGEYLLIIEFIQGKTLIEVIDELNKQNQLNEDVALAIFDHILQIVNQLHDNYIIHRDLNPKNILIMDSFDPDQIKQQRIQDTPIRIIDFGLAKHVQQGVDQKAFQEVSSRVGYPGFVAPEQYSNGVYSFQVDVFSLGALFYLLLTGKTPPLNLLGNFSPALINTSIDQFLNDFVRKATAVNANDRFLTVNEMILTLRNKGFIKSTSKVFLIVGNKIEPLDHLQVNDEVLIGRQGDIVTIDPIPNAPAISRKHCVIRLEKDPNSDTYYYVLYDNPSAPSKNGTFLYNPYTDQWVRATTTEGLVLVDGDVICLGYDIKKDQPYFTLKFRNFKHKEQMPHLASYMKKSQVVPKST